MTCHSLNCRRDSSLLLINRRCALPPSTCRGLGVKILLRSILSRRYLTRGWMHHVHLMTVTGWLRRIRWRSPLLVRCVHVVVYWWDWSMRTLRILIHLHGRVGLRNRLCLCLCLCLCCLCSLLTESFRLLLLLYTRCRRLRGCRGLEIHRRHERLSEFLLRDEGVQFGLLR